MRHIELGFEGFRKFAEKNFTIRSASNDVTMAKESVDAIE